jgi:hypothetical protein
MTPRVQAARETSMLFFASSHPTSSSISSSHEDGDIAVNQEATIGPGIVVLSPSLQILPISRQAMVLLNQLEHTPQTVGHEASFRSGIAVSVRVFKT